MLFIYLLKNDLLVFRRFILSVQFKPIEGFNHVSRQSRTQLLNIFFIGRNRGVEPDAALAGCDSAAPSAPPTAAIKRLRFILPQLSFDLSVASLSELHKKEN